LVGIVTREVRTWLWKVADGLEQWSMIPKASLTSPAAAAGLIIARQVPRHLRAVVARAMPFLATDDVAAAATLVRQATKPGR
jgi:hypothetical protein